jgi:ABC-type amino acid transport substrate-binding protein
LEVGGLAFLTVVGLVLTSCTAAPAVTPTPTSVETESVAPSPSGEVAWCDDYDFATVEEGVLTVATYGTGMPVIEVRPNSQLGGLLGLLYDSFVEDCGLELRLFETEFASTILAVQNAEADVGTYIFYTPERAEVIYYTYPHYLADRAVMYTQADFPWTGPDSMEGKRVGTVTGFVWAPAIQEHWGSNAMLFPDQQTGGAALLQGQIDGWINGAVQITIPPFSDNPDALAMHEFEPGTWGFPPTLVFNESYNIVNCENTELADALNHELELLVDSGEWAELMEELDIPDENAPRLESPEQHC